MNNNVNDLAQYIMSTFTDGHTTLSQTLEEFLKHRPSEVIEALDLVAEDNNRQLQLARNEVNRLEVVISSYDQLDADLQPNESELRNLVEAHKVQSDAENRYRARLVILQSLKNAVCTHS